MSIRVSVGGASGWVGQPLCRAIVESADLELVAGVSRSHNGRSIREVIADLNIDLHLTGTVSDALDSSPDVFVDYTSADAVRSNVFEAIERGVNVVIGSSGLTDDDYREIDDAAVSSNVGVIAAGNFALAAVLLQRFACEAAKHFPVWEIIDYSSDRKQDAPSGTVRELVHRVSAVGKPSPAVSVEGTVGEKATRGAKMNGMQVHSVRVPGFMIGAEAIFGAEDQRLSIRYDGGAGADPYIQGTLLAIRKVIGRVGLTRGLDSILDE
jgi:4-hydroxy-tetrahydrodipicolinate reductase